MNLTEKLKEAKDRLAAAQHEVSLLEGQIVAREKERRNSQPLKTCACDDDGCCDHPQCPQLRDNEPDKTGRSCPLIVKWDYE